MSTTRCELCEEIYEKRDMKKCIICKGWLCFGCGDPCHNLAYCLCGNPRCSAIYRYNRIKKNGKVNSKDEIEY